MHSGNLSVWCGVLGRDSNGCEKTFDALDQWCLRRIMNVHWTERITNNEVRSRTQQPLLSDAVRSRRLRFFGHIYRADPNQDHSGTVRQYYWSA